MRKVLLLGALACLSVLWVSGAGAGTPGADVRLTNDCLTPTTLLGTFPPPPSCPGGGYVNEATLAGHPVTGDDPVINECSVAHGRQNEPAVDVDPRTAALPDSQKVLVGSSNDYCPVYAFGPSPVGPIWLGYYRSENGGASFQSSLVPGYPQDPAVAPGGPYAGRAHIRTASAGDPVTAWDAQGRLFMGSEASDDPAGTKKTFGDQWVATFDNPAGPAGAPQNDGKEFRQSVIVAKGSSAPNLLGKFNDKTALNADHNSDGRCDNFVYFAGSTFHGNAGGVGIEFYRSTNHGVSFTHIGKLSQTISDVQFPDIAITGNSHVYVTFRGFASQRGHDVDALYIAKSTDCGATFTPAQVLTTFVPYDAQDVTAPEAPPAQSAKDDPSFESENAPAQSRARDCGDFQDHCESGYTFFRRDTQERATGDQFDTAHPDWVHVAYDPTIPGTQTPTGTTYGSVSSGVGSWSGVYYLRYNGANGAKTAPTLIDNVIPSGGGHQTFPDITADTPPLGSHTPVLHAFWWDSRLDPCKSATRPIGNCAGGTTVASLDAWGAVSTNSGSSWSSSRVSNVSGNPNYEQFDNRSVPFAGDYLYVTSLGAYSFAVWTDWRNTIQGTDPRETPEDEDAATADVRQCRTFSGGSWSGDQCPHAGGIDQNIYGDQTP